MSAGKTRRILGLFGAIALLALLVAAPAHAKKKPDLVEQAVSAPKAATAGDSFEVSDTVKNKGKKKAGKSTTGFVLSKDDKAGPGDIDLIGSRKVPKLKPRKKSSGITAVEVPASTQAGTWFLVACADADDAVKEKSETNNCEAAAAKIKIAPSGLAKLTIAPASHDFGEHDVGTTSAPFAFTVKNTGAGSTAAISTASITGDADFDVAADGCAGKTLAPAQTCTVSVEFSPSVAGAAAGQLHVGAPGTAAATAALAGTGPAAEIVVDPASWDYGTVFTTVAVNKTFTVTNQGSAPTSAISAAISGPDTSHFVIVNPTTCPDAVLQPNQSCTVTVSFGTSVEDQYSASLDVSAVSGGTVHVPLTATAVNM